MRARRLCEQVLTFQGCQNQTGYLSFVAPHLTAVASGVLQVMEWTI